MKRQFGSLLLSILGFLLLTTAVLARSGCCSYHGGVRVDGCGCNDGTPLSSTCAPYYSCSSSRDTQPVYVAPTSTPYIPPKPTSTPYPTNTPRPTSTPTPTATSTPTVTPTTEPTSKPSSESAVVKANTVVTVKPTNKPGSSSQTQNKKTFWEWLTDLFH